MSRRTNEHFFTINAPDGQSTHWNYINAPDVLSLIETINAGCGQYYNGITQWNSIHL